MRSRTGNNTPPESTRKALQAFLNSSEGQEFTMQIAKEAAQVKKKVSFQCPKCTYRSDVEIPDAHGSVNALKFMHDVSFPKPKEDDVAVPNVKSLKELTPSQVEALRQIVYTRASQELDP